MMGNSALPQQPSLYRDDAETEYAETATMSLLNGGDYFLNGEPPLYEDSPTSVQTIDMRLTSPPDLPFSTTDLTGYEDRTCFPLYSTNRDVLYQMITEQAMYPPTYYVEVHGKHTETRQDGNGDKESQDEITDFYFRIDMTQLLGVPGSGALEFLPHHAHGYRGSIQVRARDEDDVEQGDDLLHWCTRYINDSTKIKSFSMMREVRNHDTKNLEYLVRSAIAETQYRGHVHIKFRVLHGKLTIYSPGRINQWRMTTWIRWLFYLTFLWVLTWPVLFLLTSRYTIGKAVFYYADTPDSCDQDRRCQVMSEVQWMLMWERAIQKAATARMDLRDGVLGEDYRIASLIDSRPRFLGEGNHPARVWGQDS